MIQVDAIVTLAEERAWEIARRIARMDAEDREVVFSGDVWDNSDFSDVRKRLLRFEEIEPQIGDEVYLVPDSDDGERPRGIVLGWNSASGAVGVMTQDGDITGIDDGSVVKTGRNFSSLRAFIPELKKWMKTGARR